MKAWSCFAPDALHGHLQQSLEYVPHETAVAHDSHESLIVRHDWHGNRSVAPKARPAEPADYKTVQLFGNY